MTPDQSVIASGQEMYGQEDHMQAARAEDRSFILVYLPFGAPAGIHMDKLSGEKVCLFSHVFPHCGYKRHDKPQFILLSIIILTLHFLPDTNQHERSLIVHYPLSTLSS